MKNNRQARIEAMKRIGFTDEEILEDLAETTKQPPRTKKKEISPEVERPRGGVRKIDEDIELADTLRLPSVDKQEQMRRIREEKILPVNLTSTNSKFDKIATRREARRITKI